MSIVGLTILRETTDLIIWSGDWTQVHSRQITCIDGPDYFKKHYVESSNPCPGKELKKKKNTFPLLWKIVTGHKFPFGYIKIWKSESIWNPFPSLCLHFFFGFFNWASKQRFNLRIHACMQQIASVQFFDIIDWFLSPILSLILLLFSVLHNFDGMHETILAEFLVNTYTN